MSGEAFRAADGRVRFQFVATGRLEEVRIPPEGEPVRADELWRHTCFEAFIAPGEKGKYLELNFSPSRAWAAYRFDGYRSGMANAPVSDPAIDVRRTGSMLALTAEIDLSLLPNEDWRVGLSAVIEGVDGSRTYWALAHPAGEPDFHHPDCFTAKLAPDARL